MPNTISAKKRLRQNVVRRDRNRAVRSAMRTQIRKVREAVKAGEIEKAEGEFKLAAQKLDKAAAGNVIHKNTAARLKSRLSSHVTKAKAATADA